MSDLSHLSKGVPSTIATVRGGQRLCKSFRFKKIGETEVIYIFEPSGKHAGPISAQTAINSGFLRPIGDGLLGSETSQSWEAKP